MKILKIDGSMGHGGGQILRSSLALSCILGIPFEMTGIRKGRPQPGLRKQHLCGVKACAEICGAKVEGAELGSEVLSFVPKKIKSGSYHFAVGSGGSTTLVLQSVLLPLAVQKLPSQVIVDGGTYCPQAPTGEFFAESLVTRMNRMGYSIEANIEKFGFYKAGGGQISVACNSPKQFRPVDLVRREKLRNCTVQLITSHFPEKTTLKIRKLITKEFEKMKCAVPYEMEIVEKSTIKEPGAAVIVRTGSAEYPLIFSDIAAYGYSSEALVNNLGKQLRKFFAAEVPVEAHLADQLILPLGFAEGGKFLTSHLTEHLESCCQTFELFTEKEVGLAKDGKELLVEVPKLQG